MSDASKRKAKQKWVIEKPKLDNARKLRGIFFIEQKDEKIIVANSRPAAMNLSSTVPASSSSAKNLITSSDSGKLIAAGKPASKTRRNSRLDEASSSQVKLKDVYLGGLQDDSAKKPVVTEDNQVLWEFYESESWSVHEDEVTGKRVAYKNSAGKPAASSISENSGNPKAEGRKWPHNFYVSSAVVSYMDKVFSIARKTYDRGPMDEMEDLDVIAVFLGNVYEYLSQAAVHLGQDYDQNLRFVENHFWSSLKKLFKETEKFIKNQTEIIDVSMIDYGDYTWSATSLLCDRIHQISNTKTYLFADSVLCLGGLKGNPNEAWKEKIKWYFENNHVKDLNRIDGEPMEFEWKIFPGFINLASSKRFSNSDKVFGRYC